MSCVADETAPRKGLISEEDVDSKNQKGPVIRETREAGAGIFGHGFGAVDMAGPRKCLLLRPKKDIKSAHDSDFDGPRN
jgi:hypothetical protein